jgi:hypothetical protein
MRSFFRELRQGNGVEGCEGSAAADVGPECGLRESALGAELLGDGGTGFCASRQAPGVPRCVPQSVPPGNSVDGSDWRRSAVNVTSTVVDPPPPSRRGHPARCRSRSGVAGLCPRLTSSVKPGAGRPQIPATDLTVSVYRLQKGTMGLCGQQRRHPQVRARLDRGDTHS